MCSRLYKKDFILRNDLLFKKLICDDEEWTPKVFDKSTCVNILPIRIYGRLVNEFSVTGNRSENTVYQKARDRNNTLSYLNDYFKNKSMSVSDKNVLYTHIISFFYASFPLYKQLKNIDDKKDIENTIIQNINVINNSADCKMKLH